MVESLSYTYTSQSEMESIFSAVAVMLRSDDPNDAESDPTDILTDVVEEATDICNEYLLPRYEASILNESKWVRRRCSYIACKLLSERRGNAGQFTSRYEEIIRSFERVRKGQMQIPRQATRSNYQPKHSNIVVDDRVYPTEDKLQDVEDLETRYRWPY